MKPGEAEELVRALDEGAEEVFANTDRRQGNWIRFADTPKNRKLVEELLGTSMREFPKGATIVARVSSAGSTIEVEP